MRKLLIRVGCAAIAFGLGLTVHQLKLAPRQNVAGAPVDEVNGLTQNQSDSLSQRESTIDDRLTLSDLLASENNVALYKGWLIEKRHKHTALADSLEEIQTYIIISRHGRKPLIFDAMVYHPAGNIADFEFVSLLGTSTPQLAISQEVPRGGAQWIVDLSGTPRVIFDGVAWGVGRESNDCEVRDLDSDGVFEISVPITDFYSLMDKMSVGQCPLPIITFKYDSAKRKYVPINHLLNESTSVRGIEPEKESNELYVRSVILRDMLDLIYQGKRQRAWRYFDRTYNLADKKEIERRVKEILKNQPVYKYIYNNH